MAFKPKKLDEPIIPLIQVLDFETGGLDAEKHAITQIACKTVRMDTYEVVGSFSRYIKPYTSFKKKTASKGLKSKRAMKEESDVPVMMEYTDKALEVTGLTLEFLEENGEDIEVVVKEYVDYVASTTLSKGKQGKPILVGQNIVFDINFWYAFLERGDMLKECLKLFQTDKVKCQGNVFDCVKYIDTLPLARYILADEDIGSFALENLCDYFGVQIETAHDAMMDVDATCELFLNFISKVRTGSTQSFNNDNDKTRIHFRI